MSRPVGGKIMLPEGARKPQSSASCDECGFTIGVHALATLSEMETLKSRGYMVIQCNKVGAEDTPFLDYDTWEVVVFREEAPGVMIKFLDCRQIEEMCGEPDDPCDEEFMEEISS
jgi:hypothetical protein